ncbi:hypothetical protein ACFY7C_03330 [Streptomyces sp. NPDC012769]|uniref:hypothetical protein n=1 Tax=Streptomyces sp. NPDC012769 TaxID=3364848 RepID=UPI0036A48F35
MDGEDGEIEGAAEAFERAVRRLRREVRAVAAAVAPGVEPRVEERTDDRRTVSGMTGRRFGMTLYLPGIPYGPAAALADDAFRAAAWRTETREGVGGLPLLKALRDDGFEAGVGPAGGGALRVSGSTPVVWLRSRWQRPPRVVTEVTLAAGDVLCVMCEGWGSCRECEGLGFVDGRSCPECGLGMDCPDCQGTGRQPAPGAGGR